MNITVLIPQLQTCQLVVVEHQRLSGWVCGSFQQWMYLLPRLANMALVSVTSSHDGMYFV